MAPSEQQPNEAGEWVTQVFNAPLRQTPRRLVLGPGQDPRSGDSEKEKKKHLWTSWLALDVTPQTPWQGATSHIRARVQGWVVCASEQLQLQLVGSHRNLSPLWQIHKAAAKTRLHLLEVKAQPGTQETHPQWSALPPLPHWLITRGRLPTCLVSLSCQVMYWTGVRGGQKGHKGRSDNFRLNWT